MLDLTTVHGKHQVVLASAATLLSSVSAFYLISSLMKDGKDRMKYKKIPSPGSWVPFFGHLFALGESPRTTVTKWNKELGPIIKLQMGEQSWLMLSDPFLAHEIFATNGLVTSERPLSTFTKYFSCGGLGVTFSNPTKRWKKVRAAILEVLAPPRVSEFSDILEHEANFLVEQLLSQTARDGQINPLATLNAAALNVVLSIVYGRRVESAEDPLFKDIMNFVTPSVLYMGMEGPISQFLPVFGIWDTILGKKRFFKNYLATFRDPLFKRLIQEAAEGDKDCLIKSFLKYDIEEKDLVVMMCDIIAAGTDSAAISLDWLIIFVSNYPDVQAKLHTEIDAFISIHHRLPTFKDRDDVPYLICVQKECLRHRATTVFGLQHMAKEDLVVRDYLIPKGTILMANLHGMHMNPDFYTDPEAFKPERFMNDPRTMLASANGGVNTRDQFNFGFGRRLCPGIHMAEVEMFNACVRIFAHCVIAPPLDADGKEVPIDMDASEQASLVFTASPHQVRFLPRTDSLLESPLKSSLSTI